MSPAVESAVTWVRVLPLQLDLVGLVLGSLGAAFTLAALACACGGLFGLGLILRHRRHPPDPIPSLELSGPPSPF